MLESLTTLASMEHSSANISDGVLQLDCLCCLRALLNRRDGLQMFLDAQHNVNKLVECQYRVVAMFHLDFWLHTYMHTYTIHILVKRPTS